MSDTKVYQFGTEGANNGLLASILPTLQNRGVDTGYLLGMLNNGNNGGLFGGRGFEDIIALIIVAAIFGNGNFGFGNNGNNANRAEFDMLMSTINRNGVDLSQLAQTIGCSNNRMQDAICALSNQIGTFAGQNGLSFQQVINSILAGQNAITTQICSCCCDLKQAVAESNYLTERGFCNTNQIMSKGFSDIGYATQAQTCSIEKSIAASTAQILEGQRAAEMRDLQDKLDALREKNAQQAVILNNAQQTAQFSAMLAPIAADLAELKCNQVPVKKIACPETYVPVNNSINATYGLIPTYCGYNGFSTFGGWNGANCNNAFTWG